MWGIINTSNNSVIEVFEYPKTVIINNIKHPKDIFKVWSWTELNAIGIYQYVESSNKPDARFYVIDSVSYTFNSSAKNITPSYNTSELPLADSTTDGVTAYGLKTKAINEAQTKATNLINKFSWLVERYVYDNSKTIPSAVSTYANNVRSKYTALCTSINDCDNMAAFEKLHNDTLDSKNNVTAIAAVNDWPDNSNVKEYER
tara:strand:+ start:884 stop:1489 length:606 start_codon:yes stop_codon:yes gene_type:complete